ncbi:hypothetical protein [Ruegeria atlantica]|uniref:hypothetical protein n=1 Tax=Ruegeria atlantica TaxID=81569 RepID=UPI0024956335|nr:hypothetical protein [Ruegeria atlantica]
MSLIDQICETSRSAKDGHIRIMLVRCAGKIRAETGRAIDEGIEVYNPCVSPALNAYAEGYCALRQHPGVCAAAARAVMEAGLRVSVSSATGGPGLNITYGY